MPAEHRSITKEIHEIQYFVKVFGKAFPPKIRPSVSANASEFVMLRENAASVQAGPEVSADLKMLWKQGMLS